jgi:CheY-like chemotaxis protein
VLERREPEKFQVSPMAQKNPRSHAALFLIVGDDEAVVEVTAEVLETLGYDILTAQDGPEALELLCSNSRISILFTDIQMSGMGGKELAEIAVMLRPGTGGSDMTHAERAAKRARAIYEAALFSTLMQQDKRARRLRSWGTTSTSM